MTTTWVILPDGMTGPFATFYLLHGLSDDHTAWMRRTRIESYVAGKPLIVVMPDGGRGWYTDQENGPQYAEHIGVELPTMIEITFPAIADRASRFIGGLSMGGYGALRVGLGHRNRFCSVTSHSGAVMYGTFASDSPDRQAVMGPKPMGTNHDVLELVRKAKAARKLPRIRLDCGIDDFLIESNRSLHKSFLKIKIPHQYEEFPGAHTWDYWDLHVREAIEFHLKSGENKLKASNQ